MKVQELSVLKYPNFLICQSSLVFSVYQTDHTMELVNEWLPTGKFIKVNTNFRKESAYEKQLMAALPSKGNALHRDEMEHHGKFGHTI